MKQWKYWKNLPVCKVSDHGDCYDMHSNRECKHEYIQGHDYVWIYMFAGYKRFLLAKVVADTWLDNPNNYQFVRHKDGENLWLVWKILLTIVLMLSTLSYGKKN